MYQAHVDAAVAAWNEGNVDGLDAYFAPNTVRRAPASVGTDANNLAELKQVILDFRTAFPDAHVSIDEIHYMDDRSFARWTFTGTNTGPGDFPATGKAIKVSGASFGRYANGKGVEELVFFDGMDMLTQLGLVELPS